MPSNLTSKTVHGLKWSYLSTFINALLQIIYTAVMARLLTPNDFGLVAMGVVILRFGGYFAQMGMGQAIIQKKEISTNDIRSAFTSSVLISSVFFILTYFLAPYSKLIFDDFKLVPIIRIMSLSFVLTGLSTTALALIRRNLKFKSLAIVEVISYLTGYLIVGISFAISGFGVYSLVYASLTQAGISAMLSYFIIRHNLKFYFNWNDYKPLFGFGSKISGITFFQFIGANLDTLIIGKTTGSNLLGIYNRTSSLVNLPGQYLFVSVSKVLFPAFSRIQNDKKKLGFVYLNTIILFFIILIPLTIGIIPLAGNIISIILGEQWLKGIPVFQILIFTITFAAVVNLSGSIFQSIGKLKEMFFIELIQITSLVVLASFLYKYGLIGFAISVMTSRLIRFIMYLFFVNKILEISFSKLIKAIVLNVIIGLLLLFSLQTLNQIIYGLDKFISFGIQLFFLITLYIISLKFIVSKYFVNQVTYLLNISAELCTGNTILLKINSFVNSKIFSKKIKAISGPVKN